jgi:hypothetical protein
MKVKDEGRTKVEIAAEIRHHAHELYIEHGRADGHALEDWVQAEAEIQGSERTAAGTKRPEDAFPLIAMVIWAPETQPSGAA